MAIHAPRTSAAAGPATPTNEPMMVMDWAATEGSTYRVPNTNDSFTLNITAPGPLTRVTIRLPDNTDGRVGQRGFINCSVDVESLVVTAGALTVNGPMSMFASGDNNVYYRNRPDQWSKVTSS